MSRNTILIGALVLAVCAGGAWYVLNGNTPGGAAGGPARAGGPGATGAGFRPTMTVELGKVTRAKVSESIVVVGSLIGAATVDVVPKVSGRLESVPVQLGDRVTKGQLLAKVEDSEVQEQARQADASFEVARASVRQREADLKFAETALDRSKNLFARNLVARQTLDDAQARYEAAVAQLDLVKAQFAQAQARREEVQITLTNTRILSPVNGFVGSRRLDPGAFVGPNSPIVSVVDIDLVRLVANLVERDIGRVSPGMAAAVNVDAYRGEVFKGRVARIAPVLDPTTRTAQMEVEIPNPTYRLKPGMYARVQFTVLEHPNALVVPANAVVDIEGKRGVFVAVDQVARFRPVREGIRELERVEILSGVDENEIVVTTGASAVRDGDPIRLAGAQGGGPAGAGGGPRGQGRGPGAGGGTGQQRPGGRPPA